MNNIAKGDLISKRTKSLASIGLAVVSVAATFAFRSLRHVGMSWTDNAGFLRLVGLTMFGAVFVIAPMALAALLWTGRAKKLSHHA